MTYSLLSITYYHQNLAEINSYRKNLTPEPGPGENSFRVRFNLPTLAEKGSAPVKLVRRFCAHWTFQVRDGKR